MDENRSSSERNERPNILVKSCITELDIKLRKGDASGMKERRDWVNLALERGTDKKSIKKR